MRQLMRDVTGLMDGIGTRTRRLCCRSTGKAGLFSASWKAPSRSSAQCSRTAGPRAGDCTSCSERAGPWRNWSRKSDWNRSLAVTRRPMRYFTNSSVRLQADLKGRLRRPLRSCEKRPEACALRFVERDQEQHVAVSVSRPAWDRRRMSKSRLRELTHDHRDGNAVSAPDLGTLSGMLDPGSGWKSMMARRPPGFSAANRLTSNS